MTDMLQGRDLQGSMDSSERVILGTGTLFLGYMFSWGLYGLLSVQTYIYHVAFPDDGRINKATVSLVYLLETVNIVLLTYDAFVEFRHLFGIPLDPALRDANLPIQFSWLTVYILGGIVTSLVQVYYGYYFKLLGRSRVIIALLCVVALIHAGGGIAFGIMRAEDNFFEMATRNDALSVTLLFVLSSTLGAVVLSGTMMQHILWRDIEWVSRHIVISKVVRTLVETGAVAAVVSIIYLALSVYQTPVLYIMLPSLLLGRLYANSLLAVLNGRMHILQSRIRSPVVSREGKNIAPGLKESESGVQYDTRKAEQLMPQAAGLRLAPLSPLVFHHSNMSASSFTVQTGAYPDFHKLEPKGLWHQSA